MANIQNSQQTGYIFFLEWQFYQRREYLRQREELKKFRLGCPYSKHEIQCYPALKYPKMSIVYALEYKFQEYNKRKGKKYKLDFEEFIKKYLSGSILIENLLDDFLNIFNEKRPVRFKKLSEHLLQEYHEGSLELDNLIDMSPTWFRRRNNQITCFFDENKNSNINLGKTLNTNTENEVKQITSIITNVENTSVGENDINNFEYDEDMDKIYDERDYIEPYEKFYVSPNDHKKLWRIAGINEKKMSNDKLEAYLTGLWLWDKKVNNPSVEKSELIKEMLRKFNNLPESDECEITHEIYDKYKKRLKMITKEIDPKV